MSRKPKINRAGFSLIETIVYVGAMSILVVVLSDMALNLVRNYRLARAREALTVSASQVAGAFWRETRNSNLVYLPTTVFENDYGELSLKTDFQPSDNSEPAAYTDFYLAEDQVWFKKEGEPAQALTSPTAEVTRFKLIHSTGAGGLEGVRLYLDLKSKDYPNETLAVTSFTVVRGGYIKE